MKIDPSTRKNLLRDWMTASTQILKSKNPHFTDADVAFTWRSVFSIKMNEAWVRKALYGVKNDRTSNS